MSSEAMSTMQTTPACDGEPPAWYGKIPGAGDFVNHRLSHELAGWWERWLQQGMAAMRQRGEDELARYYTVAPVWNFLIPAGAGAQCVQPGCLAPSCDRVGRYYPVIATLPMRTADYWSALPDAADAFYWQVGSALLDAIRHARAPVQLERALAKVRLVPGAAAGSAWFGGAGAGPVSAIGAAARAMRPAKAMRAGRSAERAISTERACAVRAMKATEATEAIEARWAV